MVRNIKESKLNIAGIEIDNSNALQAYDVIPVQVIKREKST